MINEETGQQGIFFSSVSMLESLYNLVAMASHNYVNIHSSRCISITAYDIGNYVHDALPTSYLFILSFHLCPV